MNGKGTFTWSDGKTKNRCLGKRKIARVVKMIIEKKYLNKLLKELPEQVRQFGGLVSITLFVILSFSILNIYWGGGDELIRKMKIEEERIEKEKQVNDSDFKSSIGHCGVLRWY